MTLKELVAPSIATLTAHYAGNKLILIHPSSRFRTLLISALIDDPPSPVFYFGLGVGEISLDQFLSDLSRDVAEQAPTFGRRLNYALGQTPHNHQTLATALSEDLAELSDVDYLFIIDEYDRGDEVAELQSFFEHLLEVLPSQCHLLINSRTLPRLPWVALVARRQAVVLRDSRLLPTGFYSENLSSNPNVEVYALGPGYVMLNGQHIADWEGHLPRLLFFFVLDRPMCTRADICQAFWPELSIEQAVNVFHVTKRRLHKALGYDIVVHKDGHYRANPALNLQYDVVDFVGNLVEARSRSGAEAEPYWQQAIDLYRGHFLQGHDDPWVVSRRADFLAGYLEALTELAHIRDAMGKPDSALGLLNRALSEDFNREDLHREVMSLYVKLGRRSEAVEHYARLESELTSHFGIEPSPETQAVYRKIAGKSR